MTQPILVVGATGAVGSAVVRGLSQRGAAVRAATRDPAQAALPSGVAAVHLDLHDPSTFGPALEGVGRLFVLSPAGHADAHGLLAPFLSVALPRVERVVAMSAQGVDVSDAIPLRQVELAIEASRTDYAVLRPTFFSDNFASFWRAGIEATGTIPLPAGDSRTAFVDARDIAACAVSLLVGPEDRLGRAWEITGPEALTYQDAAKILSEVMGRTVTYAPIDDATFISKMVQAGLSPDYAGLLAGIFGGVRAGVAASVTDAVHTLTGEAPRPLATWARDHSAALPA